MKIINDAIRSWFNSAFGPLGSIAAYTIIYPNTGEKPPDPSGDSVRWLEFHVDEGEGRFIDVGTGSKTTARRRFAGAIKVKVCSPIQVGEGPGQTIRDSIINHALTSKPTGVTLLAGYPSGQFVEEGWWKTCLTIPFWSDVTGA